MSPLSDTARLVVSMPVDPGVSRNEHVAKALYMLRMRQVGIPNFQIVPYEELPPASKAIADEAAQVAIRAGLEWQKARQADGQ